MRYENAVRALSQFGPIWDDGLLCTAWVGEHIITCWSTHNGRAGGIRVGPATNYEEDDGYGGRSARTVTEALCTALSRHVAVAAPGGLPGVIHVSVSPEGRALVPRAWFCALLVDDQRLVVGFDSATADAVAMADAVLAGDVEPGVLLDWLVDHGGDVGIAIAAARQPLPLLKRGG